MTSRAIIRTCLLTGSVFLSSCAYMQTHKNIEESFCQHAGYLLKPDFQLLRAGNTYYLSIDKVSLTKSYPIVHDSIFLKDNNEPSIEQANDAATPVYKEISSGTAAVLQQSDGYAALDVLKDELNSSNTPWLESRPAGAATCRIKAEIAGEQVAWIDKNNPTRVPVAVKAISTLDQVVIDWPGTILYNVAIPVMAPFVFFYEFLNEN